MKVPKGEMTPAPEKCLRCGKKAISVRYNKENGKLIQNYYCSFCGYSYIPGTEV